MNLTTIYRHTNNNGKEISRAHIDDAGEVVFHGKMQTTEKIAILKSSGGHAKDPAIEDLKSKLQHIRRALYDLSPGMDRQLREVAESVILVAFAQNWRKQKLDLEAAHRALGRMIERVGKPLHAKQIKDQD